MLKRLSLMFATLALLLFALPAVSAFAVQATDVFEGVCQSSTAQTSSTCQPGNSDPIAGPNGIITKVARILAWVTGIVAVFMVMAGGFMYITSGGDSNKIATAKNMIIYAAIGIVVVGLAQIIVAFIISRT